MCVFPLKRYLVDKNFNYEKCRSEGLMNDWAEEGMIIDQNARSRRIV